MLVKNVNSRFNMNQNFSNVNQQSSVTNKFNSQPIKDELSFTSAKHSIKRDLRLVVRNLEETFVKELKFVKNGSMVIIEHKNNSTSLSIPVIDNITNYVNKAKKELEAIIESAQPDEFEKFIRKLLKYKEKNPFKMIYNGCTYILKHDNSLLVGARKFGDLGYNELSENPKMYSFLSNFAGQQWFKNVSYKGRIYKIEPLFDSSPARNTLVGLNMLRQ